MLTKCCETKIHVKIPFCPCNRLDDCLQLHNSMLWVLTVLKGLSRAFHIAKQSSKYWRNKRGSNCLIEFSLCTNYDSFIPLSFIHFGIPYNLKSTLQHTGEIPCQIEILFSLMYNRMVLMVVCCRYRMPFNANSFVSTLMNVSFYAKILNESDKSVNECRLNKMNVFLG